MSETIFADRWRVLRTFEGSLWPNLAEAVSERDGSLALVASGRGRAWFDEWFSRPRMLDGEHSMVEALPRANGGMGAIAFRHAVGSEPLSAIVRGLGWLDAAHACSIVGAVCYALAPRHHKMLAHEEVGGSLDDIWIHGTEARLLPPHYGSLGLRAEQRAPVPPRCVAPEILIGKPPRSPAVDVWAIGLLAFELLTGRSFWPRPEDDPVRFYRALLIDPLPSASERARALGAPELPPWFDRWFGGCVNRAPEARYPDAFTAKHAMG